MKDKKLRRLSNYWMTMGNHEMAELLAQDILDPDLRNMQLDRVSRYAQEMLDMIKINAEDDIIPPPNYSKKTMADYCLGNVTPFSCEQPDDIPFIFPVSKPDPDAPFEQPDEYREYTPQQFPWPTDDEASDHITKNDTVLVMVECVSQFRQRYVIEVDAEYPEYALDDVAMGRYKEFSQVHLGEVVVSHRVVGVDEVLAICDEDNAYCKSWSDEKKLQVFVTETTYDGGE